MGLRYLPPRANVPPMLKRFLPLAALLVLTLPASALAQGVTSSADSRATEAGREILHQGGTAADAAVAMVAVLTLVERRRAASAAAVSW